MKPVVTEQQWRRFFKRLVGRAMMGYAPLSVREALLTCAIVGHVKEPYGLWSVQRAAFEDCENPRAIVEARKSVLKHGISPPSFSFVLNHDTWEMYLCARRDAAGREETIVVELVDPYDFMDPGFIVRVYRHRGRPLHGKPEEAKAIDVTSILGKVGLFFG